MNKISKELIEMYADQLATYAFDTIAGWGNCDEVNVKNGYWKAFINDWGYKLNECESFHDVLTGKDVEGWYVNDEDLQLIIDKAEKIYEESFIDENKEC